MIGLFLAALPVITSPNYGRDKPVCEALIQRMSDTNDASVMLRYIRSMAFTPERTTDFMKNCEVMQEIKIWALDASMGRYPRDNVIPDSDVSLDRFVKDSPITPPK
jgi:hypothetical protein